MTLCLSIGFGLGVLAAVFAYERRDYPHQDSTHS